MGGLINGNGITGMCRIMCIFSVTWLLVQVGAGLNFIYNSKWLHRMAFLHIERLWLRSSCVRKNILD